MDSPLHRFGSQRKRDNMAPQISRLNIEEDKRMDNRSVSTQERRRAHRTENMFCASSIFRNKIQRRGESTYKALKSLSKRLQEVISIIELLPGRAMRSFIYFSHGTRDVHSYT